MSDTNTLDKALLKFNSLFDGRVKKNQEGYNYEYADLTAVWSAIREPLEKCGLYIFQRGAMQGDIFGLETLLVHPESDTLKTSFLPHGTNSDPQKFGSEWTYKRRYAILGLLNICPVDDDGAAAKPKTTTKVEEL